MAPTPRTIPAVWAAFALLFGSAQVASAQASEPAPTRAGEAEKAGSDRPDAGAGEAETAAQTEAALSAADALLDLPEDNNRGSTSAKERGSPSPYLIDFALSLSTVARGNMPETQLRLSPPADFGAPLDPVDPNLPRCAPAPPGFDGRWRVEQLLCPRPDTSYLAAMASLYFEWRATDWLRVRALVDTGEIRDGETLDPPLRGLTLDGRPPGQLGRAAFFVRELSVVLGKPALSLEVGRFRAAIADGLVMDGFIGVGLRGRIDLHELAADTPLQAEVMAVSLQRRVDEPEGGLIAARLDVDLSTFEWISVFVALASDEGGGLSDPIRSAFAEGAIGELSSTPYVAGTPEDPLVQQALDAAYLGSGGRGGVVYLGGQVSLLPIDGLSLRATVALMGGRLRLDGPVIDLAAADPDAIVQTRQQEIEVKGSALDVEAHYGLSPYWDLGGSLFALSGDSPPGADGDEYGAFLAPAPYWVWTGLFFSGGLNQGLIPSRAAAAGVNGRGAIGLGPSLAYTDAWGHVQARALWLRSVAAAPSAPGGGSGRNYGLEVDLEVEWLPWSFLRLGAEVDVLLPGDYFRYRDVAYRALALATVFYGN